MKHTKGSWILEHRPDDFIVTIDSKAVAANGICKLYPRTEARANAQLIAAAPELLAAVKSMLTYIETYGGDVTANFAGTANENLNFYKALINKAEGNTK